MVAGWPVVTEAGSNVAVTPAGRPVADSCTACGVPASVVVVIGKLAGPPCLMVWVSVGVMVNAKQPGSWNAAMRVLQFRRPEAALYSCVPQNVQSSVGSMLSVA